MVRVSKCIPILAVLLCTLPRTAFAQLPQGGPPGGQVGGDEENKPEGAAEKAPPEAGELPSTPYLPPWPGEKKKAFEIFELDGYFRLRTDWFDTFHLGFHDLGSGTPFPEPLTCAEGTSAPNCDGDVGSANLRLRLEPTIHLSEKVSVHAQFDVLDNLVLGSTPLVGSTDTPTGILTDSQGGAGGNEIRVKRAWAEVTLPLGMLKFGRMPSHWGLGIMFNGGGEDPYHPGEYCLDCDSGDTVDRVYYSTGIPGTGLDGAIAMDWASSEPTAGSVGVPGYDQDFDGDDRDDVRQWTFVISDQQKPEEWKDSIDAGDLTIDWGVYLVYRKQDWETRDDGNAMTEPPQGEYFARSAYAYIPDGYFRLGYKKLRFEAELAGVIGGVDVDIDPGDTTGVQTQDLLGFGGVARLDYTLSDDDLMLGAEVGFATGDDFDATKQGETHFSKIPGLSPTTEDTSNNGFLFDPNYHVDLILFRELLGTVRNATYIKPSLSYKLTGRVTFKVAAVVSFANVTVATPGNGAMWGVELDGDLGYHNEREGFFAGISYGALFPLDAMDHPDGLGYMDGEERDAKTAQTIQSRLVLKF